MQKAFKLNVEDSNCAKIGSPEDKEARKGAAETEQAWQGSGQGERQAPHEDPDVLRPPTPVPSPAQSLA